MICMTDAYGDAGGARNHLHLIRMIDAAGDVGDANLKSEVPNYQGNEPVKVSTSD